MSALFSGLSAGILSGMGLGGGMVLIPLLTFFTGLNQHEAQSINLFYFLPTAAAALIVHIKNKSIDFGKGIKIAAVGVPFALIGAFGANMIASALLRKLFGAFLGILGAIEVYDGFTNKKE